MDRQFCESFSLPDSFLADSRIDRCWVKISYVSWPKTSSVFTFTAKTPHQEGWHLGLAGDTHFSQRSRRFTLLRSSCDAIASETENLQSDITPVLVTCLVRNRAKLMGLERIGLARVCENALGK
jgi:hypothetical protein